MAGYSIIADISQFITATLQKELCPSYLPSKEAISLTSPADKNADYQIGIFLYDIQEMGEYTLPQRIVTSQNKKQQAPKSLKLKYMIYFNQKAQMAARGEDEQKILGLIMQMLYDNPGIEIHKMHHFADPFDDTAHISILNMNIEEKSKIWTALALPIQLGIYFEVSPVLLASVKEEAVTRVTEAILRTEEKRTAYE